MAFPEVVTEMLHLRVFDDEEGRMGQSLLERNGALLIIPEITLVASLTRGKRPSFDQASPLTMAKAQFEALVRSCQSVYPNVSSGVFQAQMLVRLTNDGPVMFVLDRPSLTP